MWGRSWICSADNRPRGLASHTVATLEIVRHHLRYRLRAGAGGRDPVLRWLRNQEAQYEVAIDIGAHHGLYARALAGTARTVLAVEPIPALVAELRGVLPERCRIIEAAMSERSGSAILRVPLRQGLPDHALGSLEPGVLRGAAYVSHKVPTLRLDDLAARYAGAGRVGLVKIDVEGHEAAVLRGGAKMLRTHRPVLLIEAEERHGCDVWALFAWLAARGYLASIPWSGATGQVGPEAFLAMQRSRGPGYADYANNLLFTPAEAGSSS